LISSFEPSFFALSRRTMVCQIHHNHQMTLPATNTTTTITTTAAAAAT